jgi:hypothetical protein
MAHAILSGSQGRKVHRLCQQKKPVLQGFCASCRRRAEKFAGPMRREAAISTAP